MTVQERATVTYQVTGTVAEVRSAVAALNRHGQLVGQPSEWHEPWPGHVVVNVRVLAQAERRRPEVPLVVKVAVGSLPVAGVSGWVTGWLGADVIGQVVGTLGAVAAVVFLVFAIAALRHRAPGHHCPGCPNH